MVECKHNWVEPSFLLKPQRPKEYVFHCTRCEQMRFVLLTTSAAPKETP